MDGRRFDAITRSLGGSSRRGLLRASFGSALGGMLGIGSLTQGTAAKPGKVDICHITGNGSYRHLQVSENALPAHEAHGDLLWCAGSGYVDYASCTCQCPLTVADCPGGVDTETCSCISITCEVKQADCGDPSLTCSCGVLLGTEGKLVCIDHDGPSGHTCNPEAESYEPCADGMVCANDDGCGEYYCYPPCGQAAAFAMIPDRIV